MVAIELRAGRGKPTPMLLVVTESTWRRMNGPTDNEEPASWD